ncbi:MAG TPA: ABC transporter permease [Calditrichia bacterium]|nr:ABC transporter permease [Calditrichia bacterium]HQV32112.1 ABC transporter permease [Calditrichia bacterium]
MDFRTFVALRYFGAQRRTGLITVITWLSVVGVTIGVMALDLVMAGFNGFENEVRTRLIDSDSHIALRRYHDIEFADYDSIAAIVREVPGLAGASPAIGREAMLRSRDTNEPVFVRAVDPATIGEVSIIPQRIIQGEFDLGMQEYEGRQLPGILLGRYLAQFLGVYQAGDRVVLFAYPRGGSIMARPRVQEFVATGIFEFGIYEQDKVFAYISLEEGQKIFKLENQVTQIDIRLKDYEQAGEIAPLIETRLGGYPYNAVTWFQRNRSLYSWMVLEKWLFAGIFSLMLMVAAFSTISSLTMIVMEKTREIGILKGMGASSSDILNIFLRQGAMIGLIGAVVGSILAYLLGRGQQIYGWIKLPQDVYIIETLPVQMRGFEFGVVALAAFTLTFMAALYPAFKASRLKPVEAIRYE